MADQESVDRGDGVLVKAMYVRPLASPDGGTGEAVSITAPVGRKADAASVSVALSTEDAALLGAATPAGTNAIGFVSIPVTISTSLTRPSDTNVYAANDAFTTSTSAPAAGGLTLTGAARATGGSGRIRDLLITSSADPATTLQGEIWIYDQAVATVPNDNAAFAPALADRLNLVAIVPFTLASCAGGSGAVGSVAQVIGLDVLFTCIGTANLRFLVKVKNAYTPISGEVLQVRAKIEQLS